MHESQDFAGNQSLKALNTLEFLSFLCKIEGYVLKND